MLLSIISLIAGVPVFINGIVLAFSNAQNIGTYLTILLGIVLIVIALFMRIIKKLFIYPLFKLLWTFVCLGCAIAVVSSAFLFIYGNSDTVTYTEDYVVVLGCGLHGSEPSEMLRERLDTAVGYVNENTEAKIIVSGGMGNGEDIPEAEAMYIYLTDRGVDPTRILKEDKSASTTENFSFSNRLTNGGLQEDEVVFITNDFHIYRANSLAKMQGISPNHLSAPTPLHSVIPSYLRENLALIQMFLFNR